MISELFKPSQPSVNYEAREQIIYVEQAPEQNLQPYIYCYWQLQTLKRLKLPFTYRVVSDGCIDILFEVSQPHQIFVTGFSAKYLEYSLGDYFNYVGIRFLPTGFPLMFGTPASELTNNFCELKEVLPKLAEEISLRIDTQVLLQEYKRTFDLLFTKMIAGILTPDHRVFNAMNEILKSGGSTDVQSLDVGLSQRQLRRLFQFYFGDSPKTFCQVVRFQNILRAKPSLESLKKNKIFYDVGYYDQAHFIKEFKNFYGVTPSKAFGR